jgi:predicted NACHT family NTPase
LLHSIENRGNRTFILISLKEFTKTLKIEPLITDALVNAYGLQLGGGFSTFQHLNQYGKLLVIFDGFDEMESRVDQMVTTRNFEELAKAVVPGGNSKVILTCRTPYFQSNLQEVTVLMGEGEDRIDLRSRPNFEIMYLEPFDDEQVKEALRKRVPDSWQYYYQEIQATYDLPNLSKRPVMIEMIVDTLPDVKDLPEINSAILYRKYTERWVKKNIQEERTFLDTESKQIFMEELAWEMYRSGTSNIHFTEIPSRV